MRGDREAVPLGWLDTVRELARREGLEICALSPRWCATLHARRNWQKNSMQNYFPGLTTTMSGRSVSSRQFTAPLA